MKTHSGLEEVLDQILTIRVGNDFSVKVYIHARKP